METATLQPGACNGDDGCISANREIVLLGAYRTQKVTFQDLPEPFMCTRIQYNTIKTLVSGTVVDR